MKTNTRKILHHFPLISQFLRKSRDMYEQYSPAKVTRWGFILSGHKSMAEGTFEPTETKVVRKLLEEVDILVNVGANVGYYCCHALSLDKPVIAVEPIERNLRYLLKNIKDNGWSQKAEIFPIALGSKPDILQMWGGGTGASLIKGWASISEKYVTQVPVMSLDRILGETLNGKKSLIIVDIEGAELMMLNGAKRTLLNEPRPVWMVEISSNEHQPKGIKLNPNFQETFDIFFDYGYNAVTVDEEARKIKKCDIDDVVNHKMMISTHNFLFMSP